MNFLSHYFIDRRHVSNEFKLGAVLPDLMRIPLPAIKLFPLQNKLNPQNEVEKEICNGIKKHFTVDKQFHNSDFFKKYSHSIHIKLHEAGLNIQGVKLFFVSHLLTEILIDRILLLNDENMGHHFYKDISSANPEHVHSLFAFDERYDHKRFIEFLHRFKESKFLMSYLQTEMVFYAINRICLRAGTENFPAEYFPAFENVLLSVQTEMEKDWKKLFESISN